MAPAPLEGPAEYTEEPKRYPRLVINAKEPFNAETEGRELGQALITPTHAFFVRNHGPVPILTDEGRYRILIEGLVPKPIEISMQQIRALPQVTITASLMCAGNRRTEMSLKRKVKGVGWGFGAVGNAQWTGPLLAEVLQLAGVPLNSAATLGGGRHVELISVDQCPEEKGGPYKGSFPLAYAADPSNQILLAHQMNGQVLSRDHGFPLRCVAPGLIGARSVKWLDRIVVRAEESNGFFMQRDYKMFPPSVDWHNVVWESRRPIMDFPVQLEPSPSCSIASPVPALLVLLQSAITQPLDGDEVSSGKQVEVRGYALSGGGRKVERVDVSVDGGKTWSEAQRLFRDPALAQAGGKTWDWVLWSLTVQLYPPCEILVKAVDESSNTQPESWSTIWNLRGVLNNSWHCIRVLPHTPSAL